MTKKNQDNLSEQELEQKQLNSDQSSEDSAIEKQDEPSENISKSSQIDDREEIEKIINKIVVRNIESHFSGPIPPPEILKGYEEIEKGNANRIIAMAEKQSEHRMYMEKTALKSEINRSTLGLVAGFLIAIMGLGGAIYLGVKDRTISSGIIGTGTLVSLVTVFVNGTKANSEEKNDEED